MLAYATGPGGHGSNLPPPPPRPPAPPVAGEADDGGVWAVDAVLSESAGRLSRTQAPIGVWGLRAPGWPFTSKGVAATRYPLAVLSVSGWSPSPTLPRSEDGQPAPRAEAR